VGVEDQSSALLLRALGRRIRELRTEQGYSQESFADKCGVHRTFAGTIERGESNLSFQNICRVALSLGVSLSTLFLGLEAVAAAAPSRPALKATKIVPKATKRK
jgi:transcriptional regulator with XRE-family HTH domain